MKFLFLTVVLHLYLNYFIVVADKEDLNWAPFSPFRIAENIPELVQTNISSSKNDSVPMTVENLPVSFRFHLKKLKSPNKASRTIQMTVEKVSNISNVPTVSESFTTQMTLVANGTHNVESIPDPMDNDISNPLDDNSVITVENISMDSISSTPKLVATVMENESTPFLELYIDNLTQQAHLPNLQSLPFMVNLNIHLHVQNVSVFVN